MGSGKSTLGRWLAKRLEYEFVDMDDLIENREGMTISDIFATKGEAEFRLIEQQVIESLTSYENAVIATGGGAPCFFNNAERLNELGITIYLKITPHVLVDRLRGATHTRPILANKSEKEIFNFISEKLTEREPFYNKAKIIADANNLENEMYITIIEGYKGAHEDR